MPPLVTKLAPIATPAFINLHLKKEAEEGDVCFVDRMGEMSRQGRAAAGVELSHSQLVKEGAATNKDHFVGRLVTSWVGLRQAALLPAIARNAIIVGQLGQSVGQKLSNHEPGQEE